MSQATLYTLYNVLNHHQWSTVGVSQTTYTINDVEHVVHP